MDRPTWTVLTPAVISVARRLPRPRRRFAYADALILRMWLWAVMHGKPMSWACCREHYTTLFRPRRLPSVSQFNKRLNSERFGLARRLLHERLTAGGADQALSFLDGKALPIGEYTTDPDAERGYADGRYRRGYKLHARVTGNGFVPEFTVYALNVAEPSTARELLERVGPGSVIMADANYDSRALYQAVDDREGRMLTRLKGQHQSHGGPLRPMPEARREAVLLWRRDPELCERALHLRDGIERTFGTLTCSGDGLGPLPAWVRRLSRVRRWVEGKIAVYHARLIARRTLGHA